MNNSSLEIKTMVSNLLKELIDKRTLKKLGTSIEQHMSRDYYKTIEAKFVKLKNEFNSIDYNEDSFLSIDELYNFFSSRYPNVKKEDIQSLFEISDKDKNKKLSINEFVYIYVLLEEKLKMKKESLKEVKDSLTSKIELYQNKLKQYENEELNINGISNESEVKVHLIEIKNLKSLIMTPKCKVVLNLMDKNGNIISEKESQLLSGTNPKFNEKFSFQIKDYNCYIKCVLYDSDSLINDQGFGSFIIDFTTLYDQLTHELWYDIVGTSNNSQAHISICLIYNNTKRYKDLLAKTSQQIDKLTQNIFQIDNLIEKLNEPYGLIIYNKIKEILDKKILNKSENVNEYLGSSRISVYTDQRNTKFSYSESPNKFGQSYKEEDINNSKMRISELGIIPEEGDGNMINSNALRDERLSTEGFLPNQYFPKNSSFLGKKSNQLIIFGVITSILNLIFGRIDVVNLFLFIFGFMMIYNMFNVNGRLNTKKYFFYFLIAGIVLDIIWILFLNKEDNSQTNLFRVLVFGFSLFSMLIKIILCYLIKNRRR